MMQNETPSSYHGLERYAWSRGIDIREATRQTGCDRATIWRWTKGAAMRHTSAKLVKEIIDRLAVTEELQRLKDG